MEPMDIDAKESKPKSSALSVQVFGEATSLPIDVVQAELRVTGPLPFVRKSSVFAVLHLCNNAVSKDVAAKLKISLPLGASVKKFELLRDNQWFPATAVPKQKAQVVVYKEKEKGRAVAAISNAASSNVFEMEISPLKYQQETLVRLEILTNGDGQELVDLLRRGTKAPTTVEKAPQEEGVELESDAGAIVGQSFGKNHFVCKVPYMPSWNNHHKEQKPLGRVCILWDASVSTKTCVETCCSRLRELFEKARTQTVVLYTFGVGDPILVGSFEGGLDKLFEAIRAIGHDGGTDLTNIPAVVSSLAQPPHQEKPVDAVLVFTDGVDSFGRIPVFDNANSIHFPVHVIAEADEVNLPCLKTIAAASPSASGVVLTKASDYGGVLCPPPLLQSITTDQADEAFMEEFDDGFRCVPDHRLKVLNIPIPSHGLMVSGVLGNSNVTKLTARVSLGGNNQFHNFHFCLKKETKSSLHVDEMKEDLNVSQQCPTLYLSSGEETTGEKDQAARVLGHLYAEQLYHQAEAFGVKSGLSTERVREELAVSYGFCSPESTLLMLYEKEQFEENNVKPPNDHPVAAVLHNSGEEPASPQASIKAGEVGGPKSDTQRVGVIKLAEKLKVFFTEEHQELQQRQSGRFCGGRGTRDGAGPPRATSEVLERAPRARGGGNRAEERRYEEECGGLAECLIIPCEEAAMCCEEAEEDDEDCEEAALCYDGAGHGREERRSASRGGGAPGGGAQRRKKSRNQMIPDDGAAGSRVAAPKDSKQYTESLEQSLSGSGSDGWKKVYADELCSAGGHQSASPSLFLNTARILAKHNLKEDAVRVATNCVEGGLDDSQMLRSVAYLLLSVDMTLASDLAIALFEKVQVLSPLEPQSFMDISLSLFLKSWRAWDSFKGAGNGQNDALFANELQKNINQVQSGLVHVLTHCWASRFTEVEWPAMVLLHYCANFVDEMKKSGLQIPVESWPEELNHFHGDKAIPRHQDFDASLMVWLGWDTDNTDVDLHVTEPSKNEVYYSNKRGKGSLLSKDFTQGYGPEVYITRRDLAEKGKYEVHAKYFASHQDSALTGATSCCVWTVETTANGEIGAVRFSFVRLNAHKDKTHVADVVVA